MPTSKVRKGFFRPVHLQAFLLLFIYAVSSYFILFKSVTSDDFVFYFLIPLAFGLSTTFLFLYLFNHRDFFHFIDEVERGNRHREKTFLNLFRSFGKIMTTILIGIVGGPLFIALTTRFLLKHTKYRYLIAIVSVLISTIVSIGVAAKFFRSYL